MPYVEDPGGLDGPAWKPSLTWTVAGRVIAIVREVGGLPDGMLSPDTSLARDLGADSLDEVAILRQIAEEFGIEIPDRGLEKPRTIGRLSDSIASRLRSRTTQGIGL